MKTTLAAIIVTTAMLGANVALANDPVPYPDVGTGGDSKIKGGGKVKVDSSSASESSGTQKSIISSKGGKTTQTTSSSNVKVEGKQVIINSSPGANNH
jgi:hypothetical protein